jgi:N-acetylglutamate synthase-like GNAT family acetyltransferase
MSNTHADTSGRTRIADAADLGPISELYAASYGALLVDDYPADALAVIVPLISTAKPSLVKSGRFFVVEDAGRSVIGAGGWSHERPGKGTIEDGIGHIRHVAVHPRATGRGVGRSVLRGCLDQARSEGVRHLECYSTLNAEPFYRSMGFRTLAPIDVPLTKTAVLRSIHMILDLA